MTSKQMIHMANQIAQFFHAYPHDEAVAGVADHLNKFWERRMQAQIFGYADSGGDGLDALVLEAIARMRRQAS